MAYAAGRRINLAMSGGGVKGIAYAGMMEVFERRGYTPGNITGVSAGAIAGALAGAGCGSSQMWNAMESFDFKGVQLENIAKRVPVVAAYMEFLKDTRQEGQEGLEKFLARKARPDPEDDYTDGLPAGDDNRNILKNIVTFSKYGSVFDGDYLEHWIYDLLAARGVRTFGDLRGGRSDKVNPRGYRVRMTGVDCSRAKLVVMPDDMEFYGINPDEFEVAKAVRISTCVPFAFKPVVISRKWEGKTRNYSLVDGGVFDRFPYWLIDRSNRPTVGFKLSGGEKKKFFSIDTPLNILKSIISAVQDIGIPKDALYDIRYVGEIDTTKVHYLDFNLEDRQKEYLYNAGRQTATRLFDRFEYETGVYPRNLLGYVLQRFKVRG